MNKEDLLTLKQEVDEAKNEITRLEGQRDMLMAELKEKWGCGTTKQADTKMKNMKKQVEDLEKQITEGLTELEKQYERED